MFKIMCIFYIKILQTGRFLIKMRTNIVLDDKLVEKGMAITGIKTKKELVNYALKSLIDRKNMYEILSLKGKVNWEGSIEDMRSNRKW